MLRCTKKNDFRGARIRIYEIVIRPIIREPLIRQKTKIRGVGKESIKKDR
jgi:hypothetical protein